MGNRKLPITYYIRQRKEMRFSERVLLTSTHHKKRIFAAVGVYLT
jgi:hypothetical protein